VPERLNGVDGISQKAMFGGLAFLLHRNIAVGVSSGGELMVRVGPDPTDRPRRPHARPFDVSGRPRKGWILVAPEGVHKTIPVTTGDSSTAVGTT
jgi:hypothetical protein